MPSTEAPDSEQRAALLELAYQSIRHGLATGRALEPREETFAPALRAPGACFVTLNIAGQLRGCIGSLQAHRPLCEDVAANAFASAFRDPRFPPLRETELPGIQIEISLLSQPEPFTASGLEELYKTLVPAADGLIVEAGRHRATFLPAVWESLPEPQRFVAQLWRKAGIAPGSWPENIRLQRYHALKFTRQPDQPA